MTSDAHSPEPGATPKPDAKPQPGTTSGQRSLFFPGMKQVTVDKAKRTTEDEATPVANLAAAADPAVTPFTGREQTLVGGGTPTPSPLTGREQTLVGGTAVPTPTPLSGREQTLVGATPTPTPLTGREQTLVAGKAAPTPTPLTGREQTMLGSSEATPATVPGTAAAKTPATPATTGGRPRTDDKPRTGGGPGSSAAFDAGWHLSGRKGPFTGQTWGDFELGGILGEGGMGAVYRGVQRSLKRRVAIKVLPPNLAQDQNLLRRFQLEASTASKLSSPHVVAVYAIGTHEDNHFYAMEYVDGTDLYDVVKARKEAGKPLTAAESADYILQGARGLAEAGRHGVVHRDIKPPNMMVDRKGLLKIADFGIVKVLGEHQLTMTGQAVGTPAYCSPEQGRGDADIDVRSDLYSLGVVFYELACGRKPFEATTPNALIYKHCFEEPELPQKLAPALDDAYQAVILRLLQKKAENRYQSADDLVKDLEGIKTGALLASAIAHIKGTGASEAKREQMNWLQRHLVPVLIAAGAVIATGGGLGWWYMTRQGQADIEAATAAANARLDQQRIAEALKPALKVLDQVAPLPGDVDALLSELAAKAPQDEDLPRWRDKVDRVKNLAQRLAVLDDGAEDSAARRSAATDLDAYAALVGVQDPAAARWRGKLNSLQAEEDQLRERLRALLAGVVDQPARDALAERGKRLAVLAGSADAQVQTVDQRVAGFDQQVSALVATLSPLDDSTKAVTEGERLKLQAALGQLTPLLGTGDERIQRWGLRLEQVGGLVTRLRGTLGAALAAHSRPPLALADQLTPDLDLLAGLVDDGDGDVQRWRAQLAASRARAAALRSQLAGLEARLDHEKTLPAPLLTPVRGQLDELRQLAGDGDEAVIAWTLTTQRSTAILDQLRERLQRCTPAQPEPIPLAEQAELTSALDRIEAKVGLEPDQIAIRRQRLAAEAARVADLKQRLAVLDNPVPFSAELERDLLRYAADVGESDTQVATWLAKRARIRDLREQLGVLDTRAPVPDDLGGLFADLVSLVGEQAPEVLRWREKAKAIAAAKNALAPLDRAVSIPADAAARLATLTDLVGAEDAVVQRWRGKLARVAALDGELLSWRERMVYGPDAVERTEAALKELLGLIGSEDPSVRAHSRRLEELHGPVSIAWATASGRDQAGAWAALAINGTEQRFRHIPPGTFILGSPEDEPGRVADEVAVAVTISRGFWLAESETTQELWQAVMGANPSRFTSPTRPVERINQDDALRYAAAVDAAVGGIGVQLPSEAEWEYAGRAGSTRPWAEAGGGLADLAWYDGNSRQSSQPVQQRYANALGLYDLHGNVAEWCRDGYLPYPTAACTDPVASRGDVGVARGGTWGDDEAHLRLANRIAVAKDVRSCYLGCRLAIAQPGPPPDGSTLIARLAGTGQQEWTIDFGGLRLRLGLPDLNQPMTGPGPARERKMETAP